MTLQDTSTASVELGVGQVEQLLLVDNRQLSTLAGLSTLTGLSALALQGCDALEDLEGLSTLGLRSVNLADNAALSSLAGLPTAGLQELSLTGNPALVRDDTYFESLESLATLRVIDTDLVSLSLANLQQCHLRLERNKHLQTVAAPSLQVSTATSVESLFNPVLDEASLQGLQPFAGDFGVVPWQTPREGCPWQEDGECDAASGLCPNRASDRRDCEEQP